MNLEFVPQIRAVFLLFIAISANFLGNTLSCSVQYNLTSNPYLRHLFLYLIIIFTIDFTSKDNMDPISIMEKTFVIYLFYVLLSKQSYTTIVIIIILLIATYLAYIQSTHLKQNNTGTEFYDNLLSFLVVAIGVVTVVGFIMYFNKQYAEHSDDFDYLKFIFGTNQCDKLKTL